MYVFEYGDLGMKILDITHDGSVCMVYIYANIGDIGGILMVNGKQLIWHTIRRIRHGCRGEIVPRSSGISYSTWW